MGFVGWYWQRKNPPLVWTLWRCEQKVLPWTVGSTETEMNRAVIFGSFWAIFPPVQSVCFLTFWCGTKKGCSMRNGQSDVALVICDFQLSSSDHSPIFHSLLHDALDVTGDDYPMAETMVVDGLGTIFGACFGSFYSTALSILVILFTNPWVQNVASVSSMVLSTLSCT